MNIQAWPFLVSRNTYVDYRTIVAPDFICGLKLSSLLARVAEGELTKQGHGFIRQIIGSKADNFTIAFRVIKATKRDISNNQKEDTLKDQFGREIYLFEGIVVRGIKSHVEISESSFHSIHQRLMVYYQKFWDSIEPTPAKSSQSFEHHLENTDSNVVFEQLEPFVLNHKQPKIVSDQIPHEKDLKSPDIQSDWLFMIALLLMLSMGSLIFQNFFF